ncbi:MAG: hypothetical protein P9X24_05185, partial [Candidatus Hatepunaea meridiana]|nr:hypothetical protein [Candidatus Hatepunaea meridiana]
MKYVSILIATFFYVIPLWAQEFTFVCTEPDPLEFRAGQGDDITGVFTFDFQDQDEDYFDFLNIEIEGEWSNLIPQMISLGNDNLLFMRQGDIEQAHHDPTLAIWQSDGNSLSIRTVSDGEHNDPIIAGEGTLTITFFAVPPRVADGYAIAFTASRTIGEKNRQDEFDDNNTSITVIPTDESYIRLCDLDDEPLNERDITVDDILEFRVGIHDFYGNLIGYVFRQEVIELEWSGQFENPFSCEFEGNDMTINFRCERAEEGIIEVVYNNLRDFPARSGLITVTAGDPTRLQITGAVNDTTRLVAAELTCD